MQRRDILSLMGISAVSMLLWAGTVTGAEDAPSAGRPNLVLIMADDMGFSDIRSVCLTVNAHLI